MAMAIRRLLRFGRSLGVTLPRELVVERGLQVGDLVEVSLTKGALVLVPLGFRAVPIPNRGSCPPVDPPEASP